MVSRRILASVALLLAENRSLAGTAEDVHEDLERLLKSETVMIEVLRSGSPPQHGAGVIVCQYDERTFIVTARHLLRGEKSPATGLELGLRGVTPRILFYGGDPDPLEASEIVGPGPDQDFLLLTVRSARPFQDSARFPHAFEADVSKAPAPQTAKEIHLIGWFQEPGGRSRTWDWETGLVLRADSGALIHSAPATQGFSGGPVFDDAGELLGIHVGANSDHPREGLALPVKKVIEGLKTWLPFACYAPQRSVQEEKAYALYRRGMQAIGSKDWRTAEAWMREALRTWEWEGGSVHLYGMRYALYLPRYHLGLALYHEKERDCAAALLQWRRSEVQGPIRNDEKKYQRMRRLMRICDEELMRGAARPVGEEKRP